MIKKRIKIGSYERAYALIAFTVNTMNSIKLIHLENRRRTSSYVKA